MRNCTWCFRISVVTLCCPASSVYSSHKIVECLLNASHRRTFWDYKDEKVDLIQNKRESGKPRCEYTVVMPERKA